MPPKQLQNDCNPFLSRRIMLVINIAFVILSCIITGLIVHGVTKHKYQGKVSTSGGSGTQLGATLAPLGVGATDWQFQNVTIVNNTPFDAQVMGGTVATTVIKAKTSFTTQSSSVNNTWAIQFANVNPDYPTKPNSSVIPLSGSIAFGPNAGVYIDRGWMQEGTSTEYNPVLSGPNAISTSYVATDYNGNFIQSGTQTTNDGRMSYTPAGGYVTVSWDQQALKPSSLKA